MKNVLVVCTTDSMIWNFLVPHIQDMMRMGMQVSCACSRTGFYFDELREKYGFDLHEVHFTRSPYSLKNILSFIQLKSIAKQLHIDTISCHEPVGGAMGRIVGHILKCKVIYTAHGFHFYKGAPRLNWIIYYPIEKFLAHYTDALVTINKEDYCLASTQFCPRSVYYIKGIGVNIDKFTSCKKTKFDKREELHIPQDAFVLLSVGELANRKNQRVVINALGRINDHSIFYIIAGEGVLKEEYMMLAKKFMLEKNILFLGQRQDVDELCRAADVFVHPSVREGLGIAPLEGMAAGLPLISTFINGMRDYTKNDITGCCVENPLDVDAITSAILKMKNMPEFRCVCGKKNKLIADEYSITKSVNSMRHVYEHLF